MRDAIPHPSSTRAQPEPPEETAPPTPPPFAADIRGSDRNIDEDAFDGASSDSYAQSGSVRRTAGGKQPVEGEACEREGARERCEARKGYELCLRARIWWFCRKPEPRKGGGRLVDEPFLHHDVN